MKTKCMSCGGSMKKMAVGGTTTMKPKMIDGGSKFTQLKLKKDGSVKKYKEISNKKFNRVSKRYVKQDGSKTLGTSTSDAQQVVSGRNPNNSVTRSPIKKSDDPTFKMVDAYAVGGIVNKKLIKKSTGGMYGIPQENLGPSSMKKGGSTKNVKLAAVASPKNKITRADVLTRILKKKKN